MLLAFYFGMEKRMKTAYLECNNHMDLALLRRTYEWSGESINSFSLDRITFFEQVAYGRIPEILGDDYDCCILDFATDYSNASDEFIRCGSKIIIGDTAIWNQHRMVSFIRSMESIKGSNNWLYMLPCVKDNLIRRLSCEIKCSLLRIPYEPDFTLLSKETVKLFQSLFG